MIEFASLAFLSPWLLLALLLLPIIWLVVRSLPPAPRAVTFPAVRLLKFIRQQEQTPKRAPWWLLLLRASIVLFIILAAAHPLLYPDQEIPDQGPTILVIDNGWTAAPVWPLIEREAKRLIHLTQRLNQPVYLLPTALPMNGSPLALSPALATSDAMAALQRLKPQPWPAARRLASLQLEQAKLPSNSHVIWLSDGTASTAWETLLENAARHYQVSGFIPRNSETLLLQARMDAAGIWRAAITRNQKDRSLEYFIELISADGAVLGRYPALFAAGETRHEVAIDLPLSQRHKIDRLQISGHASAGGTFLLDTALRRRPIGLAGVKNTDTEKPLVDDTFFLRRALSQQNSVENGLPAELIAKKMSVIIVPDSAALTAADQSNLREWVEKGGVLIRFAGEGFLNKPDKLTPSPMQPAARSLGGELSWGKPLKLGQISPDGPLAGLDLPSDVTVERQILPAIAEASNWVTLEDGTPLISGARLQNGWLVFYHTTANAEWSNLALSGFFVESLQRLSGLSEGLGDIADADILPPHMVMDGFGALSKPGPQVTALDLSEQEQWALSPRHPPGRYGLAQTAIALNVSQYAEMPSLIDDWPVGIGVQYYQQANEIDLAPAFWLLALLLLIADSLYLLYRHQVFSANFWRERGLRRASGALTLFLVLFSAPAYAIEDNAKAQSLHLAYVITQDSAVDNLSAAGMKGLTAILRTRTSLDLGEPVGVDIERDDLSFYALLYWPVVEAMISISWEASVKVDDYLRRGGLILFDSKDGQDQNPNLGILLQDVHIPPLTPLPADHVLLRSFYLLNRFPGRWENATLWVAEKKNENNDGVSPVIIGGNDWAAAWALDAPKGAPRALIPGGENQREAARRFGVNLVMYAVTGNYKTDQVHVPAILERLQP